MPTPNRRTPPARLAGVVVATGLLAAACAGSGADGPPVASVTVEAFEMGFEPVDLHVPEGRVEITLVNEGRVPHTFVIQQRGFKLRAFDSGETDTATVDLPEGAYFTYCDIEGHREAGMEGAIFVGDAQRPTTTAANGSG